MLQNSDARLNWLITQTEYIIHINQVTLPSSTLLPVFWLLVTKPHANKKKTLRPSVSIPIIRSIWNISFTMTIPISYAEVLGQLITKRSWTWSQIWSLQWEFLKDINQLNEVLPSSILFLLIQLIKKLSCSNLHPSYLRMASLQSGESEPKYLYFTQII